MTNDTNILDSVLEEVGDFGKYQRRICFYIILCVIVSYFSSLIYVFETRQVDHRCKIFECDEEPIEFEPEWWRNAIPSKTNKPVKCYKYGRITNRNSTRCEALDFDQNKQERCNDFIYETDEISIMHDFNLQCEENIWKLTLVGSVHSFGTLLGLPVFGMLSDRFGRKTILVLGIVASGLLGLTRSFANSYNLYVILEGLDAMCRSGSYPTIWILGSELVSPNKRVLVTLLVSTFYAFGGVLQGLLAWWLQSWRWLLRVVYVLHLLIAFYYWLIPESVRWLLVKKRHAEAKDLLTHLAIVNGRSISETTLIKLEDYKTDKEENIRDSAVQLFSSSTLILRFLISATCWVCCLFLYNGLTINSVQLSGNSYLDFILTMAVEIPGSIAYIVVDQIGRRKPLAGGFLITGLACIGSVLISSDIYAVQLVLYLLGKFGVSVSISVLYSITTEIFPTPFRNSLLSTCVMFGCIGLMAAPQMPLLVNMWKHFPLLLFGSSGILAALLSLLLPETLHTQLPSTIEEAENIGRKINKSNS